MGRPSPCRGRSLLSQCHVGSGHLGLGCYMTSTVSPPPPPSRYTTPFCVFQNSNVRKRNDKSTVSCWFVFCGKLGAFPIRQDPHLSQSQLYPHFKMMLARVCGARHWMSVGPMEGRPCLLGAGPFMLGWDNSQLGWR